MDIFIEGMDIFNMSSTGKRNGYKNKCLLLVACLSLKQWEDKEDRGRHRPLVINDIIYGVIFTTIDIMIIITILIVSRSSSSKMTNSPLVNVWASQYLRLAADMGILLKLQKNYPLRCSIVVGINFGFF